MYAWILALHVLAATIWTGGHLVLTLAILPQVLRHRDIDYLRRFEAAFETVGMPALLVQVVTGLLLANQLLVDISQLANRNNPVANLVLTKLALLAITLGLAANARLRVFPRLSPETLPLLAFHIIAVTLIATGFVLAGVLYRFGLFA